MPYSPEQIASLDRDNFDFSRFDFAKAKVDLKAHLAWARSLGQKVLRGRYVTDVRVLHVTYSLARGRPIVGARGIEQLNSRSPVNSDNVKWKLTNYALPQHATEVAALIADAALAEELIPYHELEAAADATAA